MRYFRGLPLNLIVLRFVVPSKANPVVASIIRSKIRESNDFPNPCRFSCRIDGPLASKSEMIASGARTSAPRVAVAGPFCHSCESSESRLQVFETYDKAQKVSP